MDARPRRQKKNKFSQLYYKHQTEDSGFVVISPRRQFARRGVSTTPSTLMSNTPQDSSDETMSDTDHELDDFGSEIEHDEETGLATEERRKHQREKRRQKKLNERLSGANGLLSQEEKKQADKAVARKLLINACLVGLWYLFSLSISIYNKWMFSADHLDFPFPLFTTSFHMVVQFTMSVLILSIFPSLRPKTPQPPLNEPLATAPKPLLTPLFYLTRLVPTGIATSLDIGLGNTSLRYITLTFFTMCKSSVLLWVLTFAFLFRLETPSIRLILIIVSMAAGVLMMVFGETAFNVLGFALAMSSSFFSGFRWALTQILLLRHPATSNPFSTLFFLAPIMFFTLFTIALFSETPSGVIAGLHELREKEGIVTAICLMFIPGILAFCMIAAEFTLLQRTNVVTLSICGIFKEVVTISAGGIVFKDKLSVINVSGLIITIICVACYNYFKVTKMRREAREKLSKKVDDFDFEAQRDDDDAVGDILPSSAGVNTNAGAGASLLRHDDDDDHHHQKSDHPVRYNDD